MAKTRQIRSISEQERRQIAVDVASAFPCFGTGTKATESNPLAEWTKDKEPVFALGVPVREVVDYVLSRLSKAKHLIQDRMVSDG